MSMNLTLTINGKDGDYLRQTPTDVTYDCLFVDKAKMVKRSPQATLNKYIEYIESASKKPTWMSSNQWKSTRVNQARHIAELRRICENAAYFEFNMY